MKERGILMGGPMVRAILDGTKTQTRRPVKPPVPLVMRWIEKAKLFAFPGSRLGVMRKCPFGVPGDRLWVRETWLAAVDSFNNDDPGVCYRASWDAKDYDGAYRFGIPQSAPHFRGAGKTKWRPSIHMPRWASRIDLEVTDVRVQRVQEIGSDGRIAHDVLAEGVTRREIEQWEKWLHIDDAPAHAFSVLWDSIYGKPDKHGSDYSWAANAWAWAVTFRRVKQ